MRHPMHPLLLLPLLLAAGAAAAQSSPWYVGAALTLAHEDNLYRLADGAPTPPGISKSDLSTTASLLAGLDQPFGRQRLYGDLNLRSSRFQDNRNLDYEGYGLRAGLDWSTAGRLSGNVDLRADRNLRFSNGTEDGGQGERNIENSHQLGLALRLGVVTAYTAELNLQHREVDYSAAAFDARDNRQTTAAVGLRWRPRAGAALNAGLRHVRGIYPRIGTAQDPRADRYTRQGLDLGANLELGGASSLDLRANIGRTRYDESTQRGFSGVTGAATWAWQPTGKLRLVTRLLRDTGQDASYDGSNLVAGIVDYSRTTTTLSLRADYRPTAKIGVYASLAHGERDLVRTLPASALIPADASDSDRLLEATIGANWEPTRSLVFGCDLGRERRSGGGTLSLPYTAGRFGCYGQVFLR